MNTPETSPSGNMHGMPLRGDASGAAPRSWCGSASACRWSIPSSAAIVGVRDLDACERDEIRDSGVRVFTMRDVDMLGMPR